MSSPVTRLWTLAAHNRYSGLFCSRLILLVGLVALMALPFLPALTRVTARSPAPVNAPGARRETLNLARLSERVSVRAAGRGNPTINLSDGREILTAYAGRAELRQALEQNKVEPLSLASADFDEDGVPDLVSGYSYNGRGIVTVLRGNVDSIYPHTAEAKQRQANGTFTSAPFLSPAQVFDLPVAADFIGAGDFDGDSHWDMVSASRQDQKLFLLAGDGHGSFAPAQEISLPGVVTAMTTGEVNRRDGLTDVIVALTNDGQSQVLVFEGPNGALRAEPERFKIAAEVGSLALGQLDGFYPMDLAVTAGHQLIVIAGRDRKLSLDASQQATVSPARRNDRTFVSRIRSMSLGDFTGDSRADVALLMDDGEVQLLSQNESAQSAPLANEKWTAASASFRASSLANQLIATRASGSGHDDLLIADLAASELQVLTADNSHSAHKAARERRQIASTPLQLTASLAVTGAPVAVLPMRLNTDALSDLLVLTNKQSAPAVLVNQPEATFVVTNTNASGAGSLQFAILDANEMPGADLITFNIPGPGPFIINVTAALPTITDPVTIDGTTQPGFAGTPLIEVNGSQAGKGPNGFVLAAGNSTIRSIAITGFDFDPNNFDPITSDGGGAGISLRSNNNFIEGNLIGTPPFIYAGIRAVGPAVNNQIGGTTAAARNNIIAFVAVLLPLGATDNRVQGNFIIASGLGVGISVQVSGNGGSSNTVGGTVAGARNVIAGGRSEDGAGVGISGNGNLVQGNYLGTDESGNSTSVITQGYGVQFSPEVSSNTIGGTTAAARNLISGNGSAGIRSRNGGIGNPSANLIQGNFIGTNAAGTGDLGNLLQGIIIRGGNFSIGGTAPGAGNLISSNKQNGIDISANGTYLIQGNLIGTDSTGNVDLGNTQNGVYLLNTPNTVVGGTATGAGNVISGNGLSGVLIEGAQATGNSVQGNFIGTNLAGTAALGNDLNGVTTSQAPNNTIGGASTAARNIISANARHGVSIGIDTQSGSTGITVQNNFIGTDVTGNNCLGNQRDGVFVNRGSVSHTISDNLITCNARNGVNIPNFATNDPGIRIEVTNNSIYANALLGIDLGDAGVTQNDLGDADSGANFLQNFPVLMSTTPAPVLIEGGTRKPNRSTVTVNVNASLNSTPNTTFAVHWYFSSDSQCANSQTATKPLAFGKIPSVTTGNDGNATFSFPFDFPSGINSGVMNCTATDANGNTSEFSACLPVSAGPPPPSLQFSAAGYSVNEGGVSATITVTRSGITSGASTVDFAASDGSGTQNQDYVVTSGTLNFAAGESSKTFSVLIVDDAFVEANDAINLTLSNATGGTLGTPSAATLTITDNDTSGSTSPAAKRFAAMLDGAQETPANNSTAKGTGYVLLNQSETAASVSLQFQNLGSAETAAHIHGPGAAGVMAPILFTLPTTNPVTNHQISPTTQQVVDLKAGLHYLNVHSTNFVNGEIRGQLRWNPTLEENFFVRQQYLDFLSRDGDPGGFGFWVNQVGSCGADAQCLHDRTITTSNAFFFEPEFQQTAGYVFRAYRAAFGNNQPFPNPDGSNATEANKLIDYSTFVADRARVVGGANLPAAQQAFANQFVLRSAFTTKYAPATTAAQFVDAILATIQNADGANLTGQRQALIDQFNSAGGGNAGRAMVLYRLADDNAQSLINNQAFINAEYNRQFALTLFFGYLRRNPDIGGFLFWQSQINLAPVRDVPKQNALVCSFITAAEYQFRFSPNAPRSNAECPQ